MFIGPRYWGLICLDFIFVTHSCSLLKLKYDFWSVNIIFFLSIFVPWWKVGWVHEYFPLCTELVKGKVSWRMMQWGERQGKYVSVHSCWLQSTNNVISPSPSPFFRLCVFMCVTVKSDVVRLSPSCSRLWSSLSPSSVLCLVFLLNVTEPSICVSKDTFPPSIENLWNYWNVTGIVETRVTTPWRLFFPLQFFFPFS